MKKRKEKIFYSIIFFFFLTIFFLSPISGDDWGNYLVGKTGLYHSIGNAVGMYFSWEGRLVSRIFINILTYNKWLWNIINSFLLTTLVYIIVKIVNTKHKKEIYILSFLIIMLMNIYTFSQTVTWLAGNITYLFPLVIFLIYYYLIEKKEQTKITRIINILINIVLPMFVEHMAIVLICYNIFILVYEYIKTKSINKYKVIYLVMSILVTGIMLLSPGTRYRALTENVEFNNLNIFQKVITNIPNFIYYTLIVNYFLMFLLTVTNNLLIKDKIKNKYLKILLMLYNSVIGIGTVVIYLLSNVNINNLSFLINQYNIIVIINYIIYLLLTMYLHYKYSKNIYLFIISLLGNGVMLVSPTWGFRTSLFTYIGLSICCLIILDKYLKNKKIIYISEIITGIFLIITYEILYINVFKCQKHLEKAIENQLKTNQEIIEIEYFPSFINCNINPSNPYHTEKFKEYYNIPKDKQIILKENNWKYYIIYQK